MQTFAPEHPVESPAQRLARARRHHEEREAHHGANGYASLQRRQKGGVEIRLPWERLRISQMPLRLAPGKEAWTTRSRIVGVRKRFMQVRALPIEPPVRPLDRRAVRKPPERPRPLAHRVVLGD